MKRMQARIIIFAEPSKHIDMLSEALTSGGHTLAIAADRGTVFQFLDAGSWDILIADIGNRHGADTESLNAIRDAYPDLPIICISGQKAPDGNASERDILIPKPYRISHIEECIVQLLDLKQPSDDAASAGAILVVDDDELFRTLLVRSLRLFGHNARQARDGREALEIVNNEDIHAVIADIYMPGIDGVTLLKRLKQRWPRMPVILITGYHASDEWPKESDISPDGFLMKPFKVEHIKALLENVTRRKARP